ncbi:hypothetical protein DVH24_036166 [Malus domestica]|uniref:SAC domain-containing protein n=1 Tax=Malus domestica TaxID=3750 RepID=A0A498II58_MALDO|nr:hypothetical protein DVH24_036166 [Malus domestica]
MRMQSVALRRVALSSGQPQTKPLIRAAPNKTSTIYGIAGTIRLLTGNWTYLGFPVYRVTSMRFLSCNEGMKNSTAPKKKDETYFMALLKTVQSTPGLYFAYKTDITTTTKHFPTKWGRL